ncbi:hypothetical protein [Actinophytocola sp.]|uniref:hypothetical protein n=1 Tax=Actinophytocola sp. TaxID=1872138 RepID=UPI002D2D9189|nr:hypothetical protein [Actinophytocola sp.]HYQ68289.1 hypothetical protein [Actinophytocola sp.]
MTHAEDMAARLPTLYRDGDLVRGLAGVLGLQLEILDERARAVQRAHWFDTALELPEAAALGALLDIAPAPWQSLGEYRAWFHAHRTARLRDGAVTVHALRDFVSRYAEAFEATNDVDALPPFDEWSTAPTRVGHALVENPPRTTGARLGAQSGAAPLTRQQVVNTGLDTARLSYLLTGCGGGEYVPVIANLTTGEAIAFLGALRPGDRLWVRAVGDGTVEARLNREDVTAKLQAVHRVVPGRPWTPADTGPNPSALELPRGPNDIWFLPVAHFDAPGLDRVLLALADLDLRQGRFDEATFDHALFDQEPGAIVDLMWTERVPASLRVDLDGGVLSAHAGRLDDALEARDQLASSVAEGVDALAAAGVATQTRLRPLHDSQRQLDHLVFIDDMRAYEVGTVGIAGPPDVGGLFGSSDFDESAYQ